MKPKTIVHKDSGRSFETQPGPLDWPSGCCSSCHSSTPCPIPCPWTSRSSGPGGRFCRGPLGASLTVVTTERVPSGCVSKPGACQTETKYNRPQINPNPAKQTPPQQPQVGRGGGEHTSKKEASSSIPKALGQNMRLYGSLCTY